MVMSQNHTCPGVVACQLGLDPRRGDRLPASVPGLSGGAQQPVHRRHRAQVGALVQQRGPGLGDGLVGEPGAVQPGQHLLALGGGHRLLRRGSTLTGRRWVGLPATSTTRGRPTPDLEDQPPADPSDNRALGRPSTPQPAAQPKRSTRPDNAKSSLLAGPGLTSSRKNLATNTVVPAPCYRKNPRSACRTPTSPRHPNERDGRRPPLHPADDLVRQVGKSCTDGPGVYQPQELPVVRLAE